MTGQLALMFDAPMCAARSVGLTYHREPCEVVTCAGTVSTWRTDDPFEDLWACDTCPARGSTSWSRVLGPRAAEVAA